MSKFNIIVAVSDNNVIGKDGKLPWYLPEDLKHFKKLTENHTVIMGRKCYESIGKPLPNRKNIIISKNEELEIPNCIVKPTLQLAVDYANSTYDPEIFFIGGATIYNQVLNNVDRIYLTKVHTNIENGDTFFPELDMTKWNIVNIEEFNESTPLGYTFMTLENKRWY